MSIEKTPDLGTKRLRRLKLREISGDTRFVQRATIEPKKPPFQKQKRVLFSVPSETTRPVSLTVKLPALKNTGVDRLADGGSAGFAAGFAGSGEDATNGAKGVATNGARMLLGAPGLTTGNKKLLGVLSRARARGGRGRQELQAMALQMALQIQIANARTVGWCSHFTMPYPKNGSKWMEGADHGSHLVYCHYPKLKLLAPLHKNTET